MSKIRLLWVMVLSVPLFSLIANADTNFDANKANTNTKVSIPLALDELASNYQDDQGLSLEDGAADEVRRGRRGFRGRRGSRHYRKGRHHRHHRRYRRHKYGYRGYGYYGYSPYYYGYGYNYPYYNYGYPYYGYTYPYYGLYW